MKEEFNLAIMILNKEDYDLILHISRTCTRSQKYFLISFLENNMDLVATMKKTNISIHDLTMFRKSPVFKDALNLIYSIGKDLLNTEVLAKSVIYQNDLNSTIPFLKRSIILTSKGSVN